MFLCNVLCYEYSILYNLAIIGSKSTSFLHEDAKKIQF
jgi:hypothetical protein